MNLSLASMRLFARYFVADILVVSSSNFCFLSLLGSRLTRVGRRFLARSRSLEAGSPIVRERISDEAFAFSFMTEPEFDLEVALIA